MCRAAAVGSLPQWPLLALGSGLGARIRAGAAQARRRPSPTRPRSQEPVAKPGRSADEPPPPEPVEGRRGPGACPAGSRRASTCRRSRPSDLSLLYFDPVQTYLTPYIGRAFENALELPQAGCSTGRRGSATTLLLKDFGDYGNAAARSSPNDAMLLDVAPLSQSMETFTPGERFFTLINHELAHVATMDVWNKHDAFWRHFLHGKPMPIQEHPESILYNFLATPAEQRPALVPRRQRGLLRNLDGGRARPRPGRL